MISSDSMVLSGLIAVLGDLLAKLADRCELGFGPGHLDELY